MIAAFIFPILICCIGFAAVGVFPFGSRSALIIDGVNQYLGFYEELMNQIKQGIHWTFSGHAMGYSFYSLFSYYLSSPFNLLILLLMQFIYINEAVTLVVLMKIGLTGAFMTWYVQKKVPGKEMIAVCIGCMYALSNYMLGYYSNLMWLDCVMLLPVLAWLIERLVQNGHWRIYAAVLGYCILSNYYMGFILCFFSTLYFVALCFETEKRKDRWWKSCLKFAGASVLGGGIAAVILIPAVSAIAKTTAAKQAGLSGTGGTYGNLWEQLGRLLFDSYPYATSGDQASVNLYCGCAALLFTAIFFLNRRIRWQKKAAIAALMIFYFAGFHFQTLNLVLHGMHKPVGMPNRFAFIFIFLILKTASEGWGKIGELTKKELVAGMAVCMLFCAAVGIKTGNLKVLGTVGMVLLYFSILAEMLGLYKSEGIHMTESKEFRQRIPWQTWLSILLLCEIGLHGIYSICNNRTANRNLYEESGKELQQVMSTKADRDNYRTAIVNPLLRNEELLYGLNGISMFSSTNTDSMQTWMEKMGFETGKNRFQYAGETELMDMLLGIRYLACRNTISLDTSYEKTYHGKYFDLYENPWALAGGYLVDQNIQDFRPEGANPFEVQNGLLHQMGVGTLYQTMEVSPLPEQPRAIETVYKISLKGGEHGYLWISGTEPSRVNVDGRMQKYNYWNNNFLDLGYSDKDRTVQVKVTKHYISQALLGTCEQSQIDSIYQKLSQNEIRLEHGVETIRTDRNGILFFSSFYNEGIHVRIDGREVAPLNLGGMLGVNMRKGHHTVSISYETPGLKAGAAVSVLCIGILLAHPIRNRIKKIRRKAEKKP
jgi:uncharacterized membrane protein YfhO